ncbi:exocyst complex component EXO70B1-like [Senna tora]|uniref:Exocyst subunit Exo70 family protein n=1 Tax=Senna tora TaxID=362788 RepID=A0A835CBA8_9FABA|nr:exocyst complex component EXO70B1-like [Senna tora]
MSNSNRIRNLLIIHQQLWRILGFISSVVGLLSYAWSSSFNNLFGEWTPFKIFLYTLVSFIITNITLFPNNQYFIKHSKSFLFKSHLSFFALLLTSFYSYLCDKSQENNNNNGSSKPDILGLISSAAFAFMSLCLSLLHIPLGFETDLLQFYLELFILQFVQISFKLALIGAAFCYSLIFLQSYSQHNHNSCNLDLDQQPNSNTVEIGIGIDHTFPRDQTEQLYSILGITEITPQLELLDTFDFESKLKQAIASGFNVKECYHIFITWRKQFLNDKLLSMKFDELNEEDVHKLPSKYLRNDIAQWCKALNDVVKRLLPCERHLCNVVFSGLAPLDDLSFMEVSRGLTTRILGYASAVSSTSRSPERLFRIIQVWETLEEVLGNMESLFCNEHCGFLYDEVVAILTRLEEGIRGVFMQLENLIRQDPASKVVVSGGGLHPTNRYVMNYLRAACQYRKTLERVFDDNQVSPSSYFSLRGHMGRIVELLENNLEANSKIYEDSPLSSVFMMNNGRYIVHKAKNSELGNVLGDEWMHKHFGKVRECLVNYQRSSWDKVLELLNINVDYCKESHDGNNKEKLLHEFKLEFEEICERQSGWIMFDEQLRKVVTSSLKKIVLLAYQNFLVTFQNDDDAVETQEYYFGVQDIEALINKLFMGKHKHRNPK